MRFFSELLVMLMGVAASAITIVQAVGRLGGAAAEQVQAARLANRGISKQDGRRAIEVLISRSEYINEIDGSHGQITPIFRERQSLPPAKGLAMLHDRQPPEPISRAAAHAAATALPPAQRREPLWALHPQRRPGKPRPLVRMRNPFANCHQMDIKTGGRPSSSINELRPSFCP